MIKLKLSLAFIVTIAAISVASFMIYRVVKYEFTEINEPQFADVSSHNYTTYSQTDSAPDSVTTPVLSQTTAVTTVIQKRDIIPVITSPPTSSETTTSSTTTTTNATTTTKQSTTTTTENEDITTVTSSEVEETEITSSLPMPR